MDEGEWILATKSSKKSSTKAPSNENIRLKTKNGEFVVIESQKGGEGNLGHGREKEARGAGVQRGWQNDRAKGGNPVAGGQKQSQNPSLKPPMKNKNKPTKDLGLFDLIEAQLRTNVPKKKAPQSVSNNATHQNQLTNEKNSKLPSMVEKVKVMKMKDDQPANEFVIVKKKHKKKLSTIKKRILLERLRRHEQTLQQSTEVMSNTTEVESTANVEARTIVITNYLSTETLEECDEDEISEMLDNGRELLTPFGKILDFHLLKVDPPEIRAVYSCQAEALVATRTLSGLVLGGEAIRTALLSEMNSTVTPEAAILAQVPSSSQSSFPMNDLSSIRPRVVVTLYNAVQFDDIQDEDEAQETLSDITSLCQPYGVPENVSLQIFHDTSDFYKKHSSSSSDFVYWKKTETSSESATPSPSLSISPLQPSLSSSATLFSDLEIDFPVALVKFSNFQTTLHQAELTDKKIIGGNEIHLSFYDFWSHQQAIYLPQQVISLQELHTNPSGLRFSFSHNSIPFEKLSSELITTLQQFLTATAAVTSPADAQEISTIAESLHQLSVLIPSNPSVHFIEVVISGLPFAHSVLLLRLIRESLGQSFEFTWLQLALSIDLVLQQSAPSSSSSSPFHFLTVCHGSLSRQEDHRLVQFSEESVLMVGGFISSEDLQDTIGTFPEEMIALKRDLLSLLHPLPLPQLQPQSFYCHSCLFVSSPEEGSNVCFQYDPSSPTVTLRMEFSELRVAEDVMFALNGTQLGGDTLICELELELQQQSSSLVAAPETKPIEENPVSIFVSVSAAEITSPPLDSSASASLKIASLLDNDTPLPVPKLPRHPTPSQPIPNASEEINATVKEFLKTLASLQQRAKERDPLNAKKKERFVMGLKQSINTVKSGRAKLILLAPDTEDSDVIDDKIVSLIEEAQLREIPILYTLKRRQLGKAALSSMKQSVVSVCNPEGANDFYKRLLRFIEEERPRISGSTGAVAHSL